MPSLRFDNTYDRMTSGVTCHHHLWTAHTIGMTSPPLDNSLGRTTSGLAHHRWAANTNEQCRAWHDITSLGLHARSDDVGRGMKSPPLDCKHGRQRRSWITITALGLHARLEDVGRGMTSPPLDSTDGRQRRVWTSKVALHHRPWAADMVELRQAWHRITAL
uniref:Uncharacterized protein n=1 Tax=Solanum lycopersicum TaxID=4081 RepID=A0A3Q7HLF5_SOLLC